MEFIRVEPARLLETAGRIESNEEEYRLLTNNLYAQVDALAQAWQGKDNVAFVNQIRSYEEDLNQISLIMTQYSEFLRNSAHAYEETQEGIRAAAQRLSI